VDVRLARPDETGQVAELVTDAGLPTAGLAGAWRTWVAVDGDQLLGTASVERHGDAYLLRSVAVRSDQRGHGIGAGLVRAALAAVDPRRPVALLTETAAAWFPRFNFHPVERAALDPALAASAELAYACPASAQAFVRLPG
jgi:N-acetylglutamate synthase-like GNAT family acetyltransferase